MFVDFFYCIFPAKTRQPARSTTEYKVRKTSRSMSPNVIQVAILAGGLATRLGELTRRLPKSLLNLEGKPFIECQLEQFKRQGITDIVICAGHLGEQIERCLGDGTRNGM